MTSRLDWSYRIVLGSGISLGVAYLGILVVGHIDFSHEGNAYKLTCVVDPSISREGALNPGCNEDAGQPWGFDIDVEFERAGDGRMHVLVRQYTEDWQNVELWISDQDGTNPHAKGHIDFALSSGGYVGSFGSLTGTVRLSRPIAKPSSEPLLIEYELQGKRVWVARTEKGKVVL